MSYDSRHSSPKLGGTSRKWTTYLLVGIASCILTFVWASPRSALPLAPASRISQFSDLVARGPVESTSSPRRSEQRTHVTEAVEANPQASFTTNNLTDQVGWDEYSLFLRGQRIILYSGEFHTFRLPVPSLWPDILQKIKAAGLNGISLYTHWALINPAPGVIDFDSFRALQPLYDAAREAGIWVVLRPGPYINAETTAGGIAHWATSTVAGTLRTNATDYEAAWQDYIDGIINQTVSNQITEGGPVIAVQIDNEYFQSGFGNQEYFQELEDAYTGNSIVVPLTYNDPGEGKNFVNGTGSVNIYGLDSYPQGFDCSNPETWAGVVTNYHDYHEGTNPSEPFYLPEFQGGAFDAWGPNAPGYPNCRVLTGADFESVFYRTLWAANAKMMSFYMVYGGTSWGAIPFPGVYTSYDYGASIMENRELTPKFDELKLQGLFLRSSPEFYKTDWFGNSSTDAVTVSNPAAFVVKLQNPDTGSGFYIARQTDSTSTNVTDFSLTVNTSEGNLTLPQVASSITLDGRQSKVVVTDYTFGANSTVIYSTAQIIFAGTIGERDVLFLYGDSDQEHEASIMFDGEPTIQSNSFLVTFTSSNSSSATTVAFSQGIDGLITVFDSESQLVLFADSLTATTFWAPVIPGESSDPLANFWQIGSNDTVLVGGPHLVRNASISSTGSLDLHGDLNSTVTLTIIGPSNVTSVTWNGVSVDNDASAASAITSVGGFVGSLTVSNASDIVAPVLEGWKFMDSLPEVTQGVDFDDSNFTIANHTTTVIPFPMNYGDGRILYGCDYGFCENVVIWRGHFNATGAEKSVNLSINGGEAFAASVFLNDQFLNTTFGNSTNDANSIDETDQVYTFPDGSLVVGQDNVITVIQDNMGHDEAGDTENFPKSPRGVRGFQLNTGNFSTWKLQGKVGGYTGYPDKFRGVLNEGGLFGERQGWHLPGFDTSSWTLRDLSSGLLNDTAGVGFFVTTFALSMPAGFDVMMSFNFGDVAGNDGQPYRALLFVNGWQMGKRVGNLGPQAKFPVHQGILDYNGTNTIAIALWAMESVAISPQLNVTIDTILEGGVGGVVANNPAWSPEGRA
ncbi:glycoside hydrolase family 35 protein [Stereum hirsutum FP-91666 SS1]|uniref:glycoside hydrolase family 35 protein n=1 Tax=Stereum hirsutum (strain FP-91666) TaxID=721885 RepID=UPI000444A58A|nr:glycoside hydrolase family 35 protein [Stereum hirsutum FP-91666 SS1]EIM81437.1 glycoside hydrolase family 35 protein [Stereum hirsutum FP-91666 SS1]